MKKLLFIICLCLSLLPLESQTHAPAFWKELENPVLAVSPNAHFFFDAVIGRSGRAYAYIGYACPQGTEKSMVLTAKSVTDGEADWKECPYFTLNEIVEWPLGAKRIYSWDVSLDDKLYACEKSRLHELSDPFGEGRILFELPPTNQSQRREKDCPVPEDRMLAVHKASDGTLFLITAYAIYKSSGNYDTFEPIFSFDIPYEMNEGNENIFVYIASNHDRTQTYAIVNCNFHGYSMNKIFDLTAEKELPLYPSRNAPMTLNAPAIDDNGNLYFTEWKNGIYNYPVYDASNDPKFIVMYDAKEKVYHKRLIGNMYITTPPNSVLHLEGIDPYSFLIDRAGYIYLSGRNNEGYGTPNWNSFESGGMWVGKLGQTEWESLPLSPIEEDKTIYGQLYSSRFRGIDRDGYYYMITKDPQNLTHLLVSTSPHPTAWEWTSISPLAEVKMQVYVEGNEIVINSPDEQLTGEVSIYNTTGIRVARKEVTNAESVRIGSGHLPQGIYLIGATGISGKRIIGKIAL
ncbi:MULTISPECIES: T9SS type A sorting domain-containing protein [Bacteroidales]|uniref:Secreted protein (Por secretion system target) n=1 Tax=Porphyromonas loveana TaxID=1884669 RepID=A0A2U1EZE5_9PORP|nr:T9SS type A sorting domain-containing protein [Porphyromonas loveana]PVZ05292.1 hypothetical protein C7382_1272 [Porphyromonas loveana]